MSSKQHLKRTFHSSLSAVSIVPERLLVCWQAGLVNLHLNAEHNVTAREIFIDMPDEIGSIFARSRSLFSRPSIQPHMAIQALCLGAGFHFSLGLSRFLRPTPPTACLGQFIS